MESDTVDNSLIEQTENMFIQEKKQTYPPKTQMLRNFAKELWKSAKRTGSNLPVIVPIEESLARYAICTACPKLTEEFRCTECGCFMKKKTHLAQSKCPLGKWTEFNKE